MIGGEESLDGVLDLRKPSTSVGRGQSLCSWCGKRSAALPNGHPPSSDSYCSERCYEQFRRAVFKKRSACLWCTNATSGGKLSTIASIHSNLDESKFCSECCLTQFKLKLFCEETTSHLHQIQETEVKSGKDLITPALWLIKDPSTQRKTKATSSLPTPTHLEAKDSKRSLSLQPPWNPGTQGRTETFFPLPAAIGLVSSSSNRQPMSVKKGKSPSAITSSATSRPGPPPKRLRRLLSPILIPTRHAHPPTNETTRSGPAQEEVPSSSSSGNTQAQPLLCLLDQKNPGSTERLSVICPSVYVPFPFIFPVPVPRRTMNPLHPIDELE